MRIPIAEARIPDAIVAAPTKAVWFVDNNVLHERTDPALIEALLAQPGRMVLTPHVMEESQAWLIRHPEHPFVKAIKAGRAKPAVWGGSCSGGAWKGSV